MIRGPPRPPLFPYPPLSGSPAGPRPGEPDIRRHDPEVRHQVEQPPLDLDGGIPHRGGLQPVPQRLVVQLDPCPRPVERRPAAPLVPVVNQLALVHDPSVALSPGTVKAVSVQGWIRPSHACSRTTASAPRAHTSSAATK